LENIGVITPRGDAWALVEGSTPAPPDPPPTAKPEYTLEDYFAGKPAPVVDLFTKLDGRVLQLHESVRRVHRKQYIAYQVGKRTICSVIPQRKRLRLVLPLDPRDVQHPLVRDVSGIGHWGIGSFEVSYDSAEQLDQIMRWIAQALTGARTS
jgi:predicted transport protein